jgi:hypothetical protein
MRVEFRRLIGTVLEERPWPILAVNSDELRKEAAALLGGFYESDEREFWPKKKFIQKTPEEVRIMDSAGKILARYDVWDLIDDTGRKLVDSRDA